MAKQCHCIISQMEPDQYYAIRDDGMLALYKSGSHKPLKEYPKVELLQRYAGYEDIIITDDNGQERREQKENDALRYEGDYTMELMWPWLSVFQWHGTNGCVYHFCFLSSRMRIFWTGAQYLRKAGNRYYYNFMWTTSWQFRAKKLRGSSRHEK